MYNKNISYDTLLINILHYFSSLYGIIYVIFIVSILDGLQYVNCLIDQLLARKWYVYM